MAALSLAASGTGALAAPEPGAQSVWGKPKEPFDIPPVKVGATKPVAPEAEARPTREQAAWRAHQTERARTGKTPKAPPRARAETPAYVPRRTPTAATPSPAASPA
ncbi:hypothetical protein [Streptomyces sp. G45]|uniref:hypothetical protein n=1 Tax=Streptomyces sp. G45 TaxID=3406627 RepID=UPI003C226441